MPAQLVLRLIGGVNNADPARSTGGETSAWPVDLSALFPDAGAAETLRGLTDYRGLDLLNVGDQGSRRGQAWTAPGSGLALGLSGRADVFCFGPSKEPWDHGLWVAFSEYDQAAPLALPDIAPGEGVRLWLRRTIPRRAASGLVSYGLRLSYL